MLNDWACVAMKRQQAKTKNKTFFISIMIYKFVNYAKEKLRMQMYKKKRHYNIIIVRNWDKRLKNIIFAFAI